MSTLKFTPPPPPPHHHLSSADGSPIVLASSLSLKSVVLYDWWLVRAEDQGLAVSGFSSREKQGARLFCSAAIAKRHDATTLEAKDGIIIAISGFINRSRTHQNGFSFETCNRFQLGFPYFWEQYTTQCCGQESDDRNVPMANSGSIELGMSSGIKETTQRISWVDLPVTRIRDTLLHSLGDSEDCGFDDILAQFCSNAFKHTPFSAPSGLANNTPVKTPSSVMDETPKKHKRAKGDRKHDDVDEIANAIDTRMEECVSPNRGVVTRSMSRLQNLKNCNKKSASERSPAAISSEEVVEVLDASPIRRSSSRLKSQKNS